MTPNRRPSLSALLGLAALTFTALAGAQPVYKTVGPDGRISFSDRPPLEPGAKPAPSVPLPGPSAGGALPFELRQVTAKFPVTIYTSSNCVPCGAGRAHLASRGIPFNERTIASNEDAEALQRLSGDNTLPMLTIGTQQIKGYSDAEWTQFLDAAGYPKTSLLPATFRNAPAAPLVAVERPATPPAEAAAPAAEPAPVTRRAARPPAAAPSSNPAGILF